MSKTMRDKILVVVAAGLFGYYLGLSILRFSLWPWLLGVLPPVNNRHLPDYYPGLIVAAVGASLGYLLFVYFGERTTIQKGRKKYLAGVSILLLAPMCLAGVFRLHSVSLVQQAESIPPVEVRITIDDPGSRIMFRTTPDSASGVSKEIMLSLDELAACGEVIQNLKAQEVVDPDSITVNPRATLWIDYQHHGKWYSKILNYLGDGVFQETVAGGRRGYRFAHYRSRDLEHIIETGLVKAADLNLYKQVQVFNSQTIDKEDIREKAITGTAFKQLIAHITPNNQIRLHPEVAQRFQEALDKGVPPTETDIYALLLLQGEPDLKEGFMRQATQNFMVYDQKSKTLYFEGRYYEADLTSLL